MQRSGIEGDGGSMNKCLDSVSLHRGYGCRASRCLPQGLRDMGKQRRVVVSELVNDAEMVVAW